MAKTFSLDDNNDIFIAINGNLSISVSIEAILFVCQNVVQTRLTEMIYQQDQGQPYLEAVFTGAPNIERFRSALRNSLVSVEGVVKVLDIALTKQNDTLFYQATIVTNQGQGTLDGSTTI